MAIAYGGRAGSTSGTTSVSSFAVTLSSSIAAGNLIVVSVGCCNVGDTTNVKSVTDSAGNTYSSGGFTVDPGQNTLSAVWYCANCLALSNSQTVTVTLNSSLLSFGQFWSAAVDYVTGAATSSVTDGNKGTNSQTGATWTTGTLTTGNANDLLWVAFCTNQGWTAAATNANSTPSSGWTFPATLSSGGNGAGFAYQVVAATGTDNGGGTAQNLNNGTSAVLVAFKAAAGGGGTTWNQALSDKQSALDGLTRTAAKPLADALSALDARTLATKKPLADVTSLLDALAKAVAPAPLSDRISQTDATTQVKARVQALADALSARDTLGPLTTNKALADVLCETDALAKGVTHNQVDVVSLLDTLARQSAHYLADFFASLDAHSQSNQSGGQLFTRTLSDATSALDAVLKLPVKLTADQFSALDQLARTRAAVLYLQDLLVETDALTKGATHVLVEGLSATDRVAAGRALLLHLADQFGLRDAFSGAAHAPTTLPQLRLLTLLVASLVQTSVALTTTPALLLLPGVLPPQVATNPSLATRLTQAFAVLPPTAATSVSILHG